MRGTSARMVVAAVVAAGIATTTVPSAGADPVSYSAWQVHQDAAGSQAAQDFSYDPSGNDYVSASGTSRNVHVYVSGGGRPTWTADFSAPEGRQLETGETFEVARSDDVGDGAKPGLAVYSDDAHCGLTPNDHDYEERSLSIGRFTVQEAAYDSSGRVLRFAVTFEQNCQDSEQPPIEGSGAFNATDPAAAVPNASPTPGPITGVKAANNHSLSRSNMTTLTWTNPNDGAWSETVVEFWQFPPLPTTVGWPYSTVYRGRGGKVVTWTEPISPYTFRLTPVSATGRLGPTSVVQLTGTRLPFDVSPQRVSIGQQAVLSGRLLEAVTSEDAFSGAGLAGKTVEIYSQPKGGPQADWSLVERTTTGPGGRFSVLDTPDANTQYEALFRGSPTHLGNSSGLTVDAFVSPQTDLSIARRAVKRRSAIRFSTSRSTAGSRSIVLLQRRTADAWQTVATRKIRAAGASRTPRRMVIRFRARARGHYAFRLVKPGDARHVTGYSRTVHVKVR